MHPSTVSGGVPFMTDANNIQDGILGFSSAGEGLEDIATVSNVPPHGQIAPHLYTPIDNQGLSVSQSLHGEVNQQRINKQTVALIRSPVPNPDGAYWSDSDSDEDGDFSPTGLAPWEYLMGLADTSIARAVKENDDMLRKLSRTTSLERVRTRLRDEGKESSNQKVTIASNKEISFTDTPISHKQIFPMHQQEHYPASTKTFDPSHTSTPTWTPTSSPLHPLPEPSLVPTWDQAAETFSGPIRRRTKTSGSRTNMTGNPAFVFSENPSTEFGVMDSSFLSNNKGAESGAEVKNFHRVESDHLPKSIIPEQRNLTSGSPSKIQEVPTASNTGSPTRYSLDGIFQRNLLPQDALTEWTPQVRSPTNLNFNSPMLRLLQPAKAGVGNSHPPGGSSAMGVGYHPYAPEVYKAQKRVKRQSQFGTSPLISDQRNKGGEDRESKNEVTARLTQRLASILTNSKSRKALCNLQGGQAQLLVEYLYGLLQQPSPSIPWLQKHALIALYRLSKSSLLYPYCYALKDIAIDSHESGGGFSDIFRGHHGDQHVCLKVVRLHQKSETDAMLKIYAKEAILWGQLHHRNVVPFYGIYYLNEERRQVCLVSPWMQNGNLVQYLKNNPSTFRIPFVHDIATGLDYLHSRSLIHSDLKGVNVLVNDAGIACITDFGLSFIRTDQTLAYTTIATAAHGVSHNWAAPELLDDDHFPTMASDIWALGCVFYEVVTGKLPFHGLSDAQIIRKLIAGATPQPPNHLDLEAIPGAVVVWTLIQSCWVIEPEGRPTCQQILEALVSDGLTRSDGTRLTAHDMRSAKLRFKEAMKRSQEVPIDYAAVEHILGGISTGGNRN